jgi:transposase
MPVLQYMGKRRARLEARGDLPRPDRTGLYTTAIGAVTAMGPIAVYCTGRRHAGENLAALLDRRSKELAAPLVMYDGLDHNRPAGHVVEEANCLVHGRRGIVDQTDNYPAECRHILEQIGFVCAVEDACRTEGLDAEPRLAAMIAGRRRRGFGA